MIDWNSDGVAEYTTSSSGLLSGQTHTQSKSCSTATCTDADLSVTLNARTVGVTPWWADTQTKNIVVN